MPQATSYTLTIAEKKFGNKGQARHPNLQPKSKTIALFDWQKEALKNKLEKKSE